MRIVAVFLLQLVSLLRFRGGLQGSTLCQILSKIFQKLLKFLNHILGQPYNFLLNSNVLDGYSNNHFALVVIDSYYIIAWRFRITKYLTNF